MALRLVAIVVLCAFLSSCAHQGVIVDKTSREYPFSESIGVGGSFAFLLKDSTGAIHRQLVTPEVFARYEIGQYFNDLQPASAGQQQQLNQRSDGKTMLTAVNTRQTGKTRHAVSTSKGTPARSAASTSSTKIAAKPKAKTKTGSKIASKRSGKKRKSAGAIAAKKAAPQRANVTMAKTEVATQPAAAPAPAAPSFVTRDEDVEPFDIVDIGRVRRVR